MPINYEKLMACSLPEIEHSFTERDTMLYALGVGIGCDPLDEQQLRFVYEKDLMALPTMACVLGNTSIRNLDLGINYLKALHGEQQTTIHKALPTKGTVVARFRVKEAIDRGEKGALIALERELRDKMTGDLLATDTMGVFARADGGFGGPKRSALASHEIPSRSADAVCEFPTSAQAALIYRLSGDHNPLHAEPATARKAGFDRPILHGLATYGVIGHAVLKVACNYDPARLKSIAGRFSSPVYPGETIRTEIWLDGSIASLRASVPQRGVVVFNNGRAAIRP